MAIVLVVMYIAAHVLKRRQNPGSGGPSLPSLDTLMSLGKPSDKSATKKAPKPKKAPRPAVVQVLGRQGVGKGAAVSVIRAGDRTLVIGITDQQVTLLAELDDQTAETSAIDVTDVEGTQSKALQSGAQWTGSPAALTEMSGSDQTWKGLLAQVRERTVRRA